ncbi:MAG: hypothetical protein KDE56_05680 [Anaerolineales bacterium]|nr:hypothetical protein [Anaerolineales bacterium]
MKSIIDTQFYAPRLPVSIVALPNAYEAHAIRALLEMLEAVVSVHWIGTPGDFLKVLGQGDSAPRYLFIAGHGDADEGFWLSSYADFIDTSMLRGEYLPADAIEPVVDLPGCTVITSACGGGSAAMGRAFTHNRNIEAYIGCRVGPNGSDMDVFMVNFFFQILRKGLTDRDAWRQAMLATNQPEIYQMSFFHRDGHEERYVAG